MEKDLIKFYKNIKYIASKQVCEYEDEKGTYIPLQLGNLITSCEYQELDKKELDVAIFKKLVGKDQEFEKITVTRQKQKSEITKNKKDDNTIVDVDTKVSRVWFVRNGLQMTKAFNQKEQALEFAKTINEEIYKKTGLLEK